MGRNKIPIKKLKTASQRRGTFKYKRPEGIKKKAKELSILSDAQVLLLMCDPNGQYDVTCHGVTSTFDGVVQKFLSESQKNLDDSRRDRMEILQKSYKKDSHAINAISLMDHGMKAINKNHSSLGKSLRFQLLPHKLYPSKTIAETELNYLADGHINRNH